MEVRQGLHATASIAGLGGLELHDGVGVAVHDGFDGLGDGCGVCAAQRATLFAHGDAQRDVYSVTSKATTSYSPSLALAWKRSDV